jgi:hypothetical protein
MTEQGRAFRFLAPRRASRWRASGLVVLIFGVGAFIGSCSSSGPDAAQRPPSTTSTTSAPSTTSPTGIGTSSSTSPQQTVETWFSEVNAKSHSAPALLAQPLRHDWEATRVTSWPSFSNVSCRPISESGNTATVHCGFVESRFAGAATPNTAWTVHLVKQPDGSWLIARYGKT